MFVDWRINVFLKTTVYFHCTIYSSFKKCTLLSKDKGFLVSMALWAAHRHMVQLHFGCPEFKSCLVDLWRSRSPLSLPLASCHISTVQSRKNATMAKKKKKECSRTWFVWWFECWGKAVVAFQSLSFFFYYYWSKDALNWSKVTAKTFIMLKNVSILKTLHVFVFVFFVFFCLVMFCISYCSI